MSKQKSDSKKDDDTKGSNKSQDAGIEIDTVELKDDVSLNDDRGRYNNLSNITSFLIILALFFAIFTSVSFQKIPKHTEDVIRLMNKTINYDAPQEINLSEFISISDKYYSRDVMITGFLRQEKISTGIGSSSINKYVIDDYGNKIELILGYFATRDYETFFITNKTSEEIYSITGLLRKSGGDLVLNVNKITVSERPTVSEQKMALVKDVTQITIDDHMKLNYSYGFKRVLCMFTC